MLVTRMKIQSKGVALFWRSSGPSEVVVPGDAVSAVALSVGLPTTGTKKC